MVYRAAATIFISSLVLFQSGVPLHSQQPVEHATGINLSHGLPLVKVTVNGKSFEFIVDTGTADETIVSPALARKLNLQSSGQKRLTDLADDAGRVVDVVTLDTLSMAGLDFHSVPALVNQFPGSDHGCDGVLGFKLFRDKTLTLDYPRKRLSVSEEPIAAQGGPQVLPFRMKGGIPVVTIAVNGHETDAAIDSGSSGLSLPEAIGKGLAFSGNIVPVAMGQTQVSKFLVRGGTMIGEVGLGAYRFNGPYIEMSSIFPIASLGTSALKDFAVSFDQHSNAVRFVAAKRDHRIGVPAEDELHLPVSGDVISQAIMSHGQL